MNVYDNKSKTNTTDAAAGQDQRAQLPAVPAFQPKKNYSESAATGEGNEQQPSAFTVQLKKDNANTSPGSGTQPDQTSLPLQLRKGVEKLSGTSLENVKVYFNSAKPAQFKAYAYAQGSDIHIAPGQEHQLPHEAWHVAQQKQGRVQPTTQLQQVPVNDDACLEKEADEMGARAMQQDTLASGFEKDSHTDISDLRSRSTLKSAVQRQQFDLIHHSLAAGAVSDRAAVTQHASGRLLSEDGKAVQEGQLTKSEFLSLLRESIKPVAAQVLEPVGLAQADCPDLNYWIGYYQQKDAAYVEQALTRYAPGSATAANANEFIGHIVLRVHEGLVQHVATGSHEVEPGEAPAALDAKRPDPSILTMQRKEAPIQFGICGSSKKDQEAEAARQAEEARAEDARLTASAAKLNGFNVGLKAIRAEGKETQYKRLGKLFGYEDKDQMNPEAFGERAVTLEDLGTQHASEAMEILQECGGTQQMIMETLFGKKKGNAMWYVFKSADQASFAKFNAAGEPGLAGKKEGPADAAKIKSESKELIEDRYGRRRLQASNVDAVFADINKPGKVICFSAGGEHSYTIGTAKAAAAPTATGGAAATATGGGDTKEPLATADGSAAAAAAEVPDHKEDGYLSGPSSGAIDFFLYQGWVGNFSILDDRFTKKLSAGEVRQLLTEVTNEKTMAKPFGGLNPVNAFAVYKVYDL